MVAARTPAGLDEGGRRLWREITAVHELDEAQRVQLLEACRQKDRLDKLDAVLRGDAETWMRLVLDANDVIHDVRISSAARAANDGANVMKQLLAALRLPDAATGKRPQTRPPRGAQAPDIPGGKPAKVSSLERARMARDGG